MHSETLVVASPTGVDVELAIAGPGSRAYAFIIDWHIRALIAVCWLVGVAYLARTFGHFSATLSTVIFWAASLPASVIYFLYHPLLEWLMHGRTPGKRIAGVRIVSRQGATPTTLAILIRNAFRMIDSLPGFYIVGFCTTVFNAQRARFGDLAAGTLLVHDGESEAKALKQLGSLALNPILDPATVTLGNDLLLRWPQLDPMTRRRMARELIARISRQVASSQPAVALDALDDRALRQQLRVSLSGRAP